MRAEWEREYVEYTEASLARLQRLAYVLSGDRHRAADLVQNTLVKLYVRWSRLRTVEHLDAYVRKMLLRQFLVERRQPWARIRLTATVPDAATSGASGPEDRSMLVGALRRLPPRQRAVLVLRFLYDQPVDEVATLLDCSPGTVKSQTSKGLAGMRRLLDEPVAVPSSPRSTDGHR